MAKLRVVSDFDANESFEAEGETLEDALFDALKQLGWNVCDADDNDNADDMEETNG